MGAVSRASPPTTLRQAQGGALRQAQGRLRAGRRSSAGWALSAGRRRRRPFGKLRAGSELAAGLALGGRCQRGVADADVELAAGLVYGDGAQVGEGGADELAVEGAVLAGDDDALVGRVGEEELLGAGAERHVAGWPGRTVDAAEVEADVDAALEAAHAAVAEEDEDVLVPGA